MKRVYLRQISAEEHFRSKKEIVCDCCLEMEKWQKAQYYGLITNKRTCCNHADTVDKEEYLTLEKLKDAFYEKVKKV